MPSPFLIFFGLVANRTDSNGANISNRIPRRTPFVYLAQKVAPEKCKLLYSLLSLSGATMKAQTKGRHPNRKDGDDMKNNNKPTYTGEYNYRLVYITENGEKYTKTNSYSIPLERVNQELKELFWGVDEIGATIIEVKVIAVSI